jgi:hypothetical protein
MPRKIKRRKKKRVYQTGTSNKKKDRQRKALPPGKRKSRTTGRTYYERRKDRSDMPGQLTGTRRTSINTASDAVLRKELIGRIEDKRNGLVIRKLYKTRKKTDKKKLQKQINLCNADLRKLEKPK